MSSDRSLNITNFTTVIKSKTSKTKDDIKPKVRSRKRHLTVFSDDDYGRVPIGGISVRIPVGLDLYKSQRLMIVRIIDSLKNNKNALIESPTGSGKTMALLAATCSWLETYNENRRSKRLTCPKHGRAKDELDLTSKFQNAGVEESMNESSYLNQLQDDTAEFDAFSGNLVGNDNIDNSSFLPDADCTCDPAVRIYYGTRTHQQIAQVVKEFGRLPFAHSHALKHTILASREQLCINSDVMKAPDSTAACKEAIAPEGVGCIYRQNLRQRFDNSFRLRALIGKQVSDVWDVEDLKEALAQPQICPYYASTRTMTMDADIIFTPFNYLIDPIIRNSSDVHLKNCIVILDEAHNVEDTCRDSASFTFKESEFNNALRSFNEKMFLMKEGLENKRIVQHAGGNIDEEGERLENDIKGFVESMHRMHDLLKRFHSFFLKIGNEANDKRQARVSFTWQASAFTQELDDAGLLYEVRSDIYRELRHDFETLTGSRMREPGATDASDEILRMYRVETVAIVIIEKFLYFLTFYNNEFRPFYKMNVTFENISFDSPNPRANRRPRGHRGVARYNEEGFIEGADIAFAAPINKGSEASLNFWCMSPSISFSDAFKTCRSVILASGTLTPMETLRTELGVEFPVHMEGQQVIPHEQIFAAVVPRGPNGGPFVCTYQNMQDDSLFLELGRMIVNVCSIVPKGVLVFVGSYRVLNNVMRIMNFLKEINKYKHVFCEQKGGASLQTLLEEYNEAIENPKDGRTGALMIAVFRGKVSEGIDFADDKARCVICVGIPYPNAMDELVLQKKMYNDLKSRTSKVLSGDEWYSTQAYRALNQALGRCLRHRNDWGALLLVDERFLEKARDGSPDAKKISRWVRHCLQKHDSYKTFTSELAKFVEKRTAIDEAKPEVKSFREMAREVKNARAATGSTPPYTESPRMSRPTLTFPKIENDVTIIDDDVVPLKTKPSTKNVVYDV